MQAQQLAAQVANWAAQLEFQKERFRLLEMPEFQQGLQLEVDKFAWAKAEGEWKRAFEEASLTGTYNGQPTTQWLTEQARLTGVLNGQQTIEGKLTDAQIAQMNSRMKLENDQFVSTTTGYFNGQKTFERERWEGEQGLQGLQLLASLQGPGNAFKQMRVLGAMGQDLQSMMGAWAGTYGVAGSGGTGASPGQAQISDLWGGNGLGTAPGATPAGGMAPGAGLPGVQPPGPALGPTPAYNNQAPGGESGGYSPYGMPEWNPTTQQYYRPGIEHQPHGIPVPPYTAAGTPEQFSWMPTYNPPPVPAVAPDAPAYTYSPAGVQAPVDAWNYQAAGVGEIQALPPGVASNPATPDVSTQVPVSPGTVANILNTRPYAVDPMTTNIGGTYNPYTAGRAGTGELMPGQINAENYENMNVYAKKLGWAEFENRGWDVEAAQDAYRQSLPKYAGPERGKIAGF